MQLPDDRTTVLPSIAIYEEQEVIRNRRDFNVICVGPFDFHSGFDLAIRSFAAFYYQLDMYARSYVELTIIGKGKTARQLNEIIREVGLPPGKIQMVDSEDPGVINRHLSEAWIFFDPSHSMKSWVLSQALARGLTVVCFDREDTRQVVDDTCSKRIPIGRYAESVDRFADQLLTLFHQPELLDELSYGARRRFEEHFSWSGRGDAIANVYWSIYHRDALSKLIDGQNKRQSALVPKSSPASSKLLSP